MRSFSTFGTWVNTQPRERFAQKEQIEANFNQKSPAVGHIGGTLAGSSVIKIAKSKHVLHALFGELDAEIRWTDPIKTLSECDEGTNNLVASKVAAMDLGVRAPAITVRADDAEL